MQQEHVNPLPSPLITWVLIADGQQAKIYDCLKAIRRMPLAGANKHHYYDEKSGHELVPVLGGVLNAESINDYQIGHDLRGRSSSSNSPTHNTYEPHGNIDAELDRRFIENIASKLHHASEEKFFDQLVLVAPAKVLGELEKFLPADVKGLVVAKLAKDLMPYQGNILMEHLHDTLGEAHIE
jgi:protein required for attachment to host cells